MSEPVRVDLRQATLSESARLREGEGEPFLIIDNPPPVRSLLRVTVGEDERAFEVARVIEVIDEDEPNRGCYGTFVDNERLAEQAKVGSEHLEPGISNSGVPAPVVIMSTGDMMLDEAGEDGEEAAEAAAEGDSEAEAEAEAEDASESDSEGDAESNDAEGEGDSDDGSEGEGDSDAESGSEDEDEGDSD